MANAEGQRALSHSPIKGRGRHISGPRSASGAPFRVFLIRNVCIRDRIFRFFDFFEEHAYTPCGYRAFGGIGSRRRGVAAFGGAGRHQRWACVRVTTRPGGAVDMI